MTSRMPSAAPSASPSDLPARARGFRGRELPAAANADLASRVARSAAAGAWALASTYASILMVASPWTGLFVMAATFVVPTHGLAGLLGLVATEGWGRALARPAHERADARLQGLLVGLALGLSFRLAGPLVAVLVLAGLGAVVVTPLVRRLFDERLGLPSLALPFGLVAVGVLLAAERWSGLEPTLAPTFAAARYVDVLPAPLEAFVRAVGATAFQLSLPGGALVLFGLALASRWAVALAALGFASGALVWIGLGGSAAELTGHLVGLNFVLVGVALGGAMVVLSPGSLALAAVGAALTAGIAAALLTVFGPYQLPTLAFPFVVSVGLVLALLRVRGPDAAPVALVETPLATPERSLESARFRARRFAPPGLPLLRLPVLGEWVVTQGFHGDETHVGRWAHAWDLEVADAEGHVHRETDGRPLAPEDFYCWGASVLAPGAGTVVAVERELPDSPVGAPDLVHNWGNHVVLWHGADVYSLVCHLQRGSVVVGLGQQVAQGQLLGKVGSSGRAPTPHLHIQAQRSPEVGAATTPSAFWQIVATAGLGPSDRSGLAGRHTTAGGGAQVPWGPRPIRQIRVRRAGADAAPATWKTHAVPEVGDVVVGFAPDEPSRAALALPLVGALRWRRDDGPDETWRASLDALGGRALESDRGGRLRVFADLDHTITFDLVGAPHDSLLALFHLAVPRAPHAATTSGKDAAVFDDELPARAWSSGWGRLAQDLARPFAELGVARARSTAALTPEGYRLETRVGWSRAVGPSGVRPDRLETIWRPGHGPVALRAWVGEELVASAHTVQEENP